MKRRTAVATEAGPLICADDVTMKFDGDEYLSELDPFQLLLPIKLACREDLVPLVLP